MSFDSIQGLIDRDRFDKWQVSLIYEKKVASSNQRVAEKNQRELAQVAEAGPRVVCDYLLNNLSVKDRQEADRLVPKLPNPLTPAEMQRLPIHAERKIAESLQDVMPAQAADPAFWTLCHAIWIGRQMFGDDVVAAFMIGANNKTSDQRTRNFLRRVGGLNRVRGNVSVLEDCPISAAWWKCRIAKIASNAAQANGESLVFAKAHEVLWHTGVWNDNLVRWSLRRVTVLSAPTALAALISVLANHDLAPKQAEAKKQVEAVMLSLAKLGHNYSINSVPWDRLVAVAEEGLAQADQIDVTDEVDENE